MNEQWKELKETIVELRDSNGTGTQQEVYKFLANYMEVLEKQMQEPCKDTISREDALMCLTGEIKETDTIETIIARSGRRIKSLPSVKPQEPKTGHWIEPQQDDGMSDPIYYQVRCSECGFDLDPQTWHMELHQYGADKFCPNCGAKMVEPTGKRGISNDK